MWAVICEPVDDTLASGVNRSAIGIMITDGVERLELVRVGLVRRNTKNADVEFGTQLQIELDKAQEIVTTLNEHDAEAEAVRKDAASVAAARIKEIIGRVSAVPV